MRALPWATLAVLASLAANANADVWSRLHGHWEGEGQVSGMQAAISLTFRPALGGRAHHLAFDNQMRAADGKTWPFAAEAIYVCASDSDSGNASPCRGHWYDSRGLVLPVTVEVAADHLRVDWGDASTERGRTEYRLRGSDRLQISDEVLAKDGVWKSFGRSELQRQP